MSFKIVLNESNIIEIHYYFQSLFDPEGVMHSAMGIYPKDIPDLIKALNEVRLP